GKQDLPEKAVAAGLRGPFLHGPYADPLTEALGPTTSRLHNLSYNKIPKKEFDSQIQNLLNTRLYFANLELISLYPHKVSALTKPLQFVL
ncbi:MAG: hypothetical protein PHC38_01690, partial [Weeksellaceae bacterium]|nr:hypothetical protein [Weeksellaceae bacterium]